MLKNKKTLVGTYSVGAELRYRMMDEANRLRPPAPGQSTYNLWRFTPWISVKPTDRVTVYAQGIDASAFGYDAPYGRLGIDENRSDLLQAWVEVQLTDQLSYRYGRQFLKYGAQRLLSPLAWANTYRNFEGHRLRFDDQGWTIDWFTMHSVNAAAGNVFRPTSFDRAESDQRMSGMYASFQDTPNDTFDFYWLWFEDVNDSAAEQDGSRHTFGMRWAGKRQFRDDHSRPTSEWHWDGEGAFQSGRDNFGTHVNAPVAAGFFALDCGMTFNTLPWTPTIDSIFYWGSGDKHPNDQRINTFSSLHPLGHAHWGLIDNFNGSNLFDYGLRTTLRPTQRLTLSAAVHGFQRATVRDAVYNVAGGLFAVGAPGHNLGTELDLVATLDVSEAMQVQLGQFWFNYGNAIAAGAPRPNARQFYVMTTMKF